MKCLKEIFRKVCGISDTSGTGSLDADFASLYSRSCAMCKSIVPSLVVSVEFFAVYMHPVEKGDVLSFADDAAAIWLLGKMLHHASLA